MSARWCVLNAAEYRALLNAPPPGCTVHMVIGELSDLATDRECLGMIEEAAQSTAEESALRGRTVMHVLPNASHWVHVDNPLRLIEMMRPSLLEIAGQAVG